MSVSEELRAAADMIDDGVGLDGEAELYRKAASEIDEWRALAIEARNRLCASHVREHLKEGLIKRIDAKAAEYGEVPSETAEAPPRKGMGGIGAV